MYGSGLAVSGYNGSWILFLRLPAVREKGRKIGQEEKRWIMHTVTAGCPVPCALGTELTAKAAATAVPTTDTIRYHARYTGAAGSAGLPTAANARNSPASS